MDTFNAVHKGSKHEEHLRKTNVAFLTCEDWVTSGVYTVGANDSVDQARRPLRTYRMYQLPVVDEGKLIGSVTDRDLRGAGLTAAGASIPTINRQVVTGDTRVGSIVTHPVVALAPPSRLDQRCRGNATAANRIRAHRG
jgi:CBS domain-containing protein